MVAVGYGTTDDTQEQYAIVRNSWGSYWGEDGYVRVKITPGETNGGTCNLYKYGNYPIMHPIPME